MYIKTKHAYKTCTNELHDNCTYARYKHTVMECGVARSPSHLADLEWQGLLEFWPAQHLVAPALTIHVYIHV